MYCIYTCVQYSCTLLLYRRFYSSGTKEEYTELCQLLEDIASYVKDCEELKNENGKMIKKKEAEDKQKGEEMRKAAMEGLASKYVYIWCMCKINLVLG